jgi:hypothetical protein
MILKPSLLPPHTSITLRQLFPNIDRRCSIADTVQLSGITNPTAVVVGAFLGDGDDGDARLLAWFGDIVFVDFGCSDGLKAEEESGEGDGPGVHCLFDRWVGKLESEWYEKFDAG